MMITIYGSNLAALVCAVELVRKGLSLRLKFESSSILGGHFSGLQLESKKIDLGMVLLEPRFSDVQKPVSEYCGQFGRLLNDFNRSVFDWLDDQNIGRQLVKVQTVYQNRLYEDFMISDSLKVLDALNISYDEIEKLKTQMLDDPNHLHPRNKNDISVGQMPMADFFPEVYGNQISEFLLQIAEKIGGPDALQLPVQFHRLLWLPLYYPESIIGYIESEEDSLNKLEFWSPQEGGVSGVVQHFIRILEESESAHVESIDKNTSPECQLADIYKDSYDSESEVLIHFNESSTSRSTAIKNKKIHLAFVVYESSDATQKKVTHNVDPDTRWFRVSESLSSEGVIVVELGFIENNESDLELLDRANQALDLLRIKAKCKPVLVRKAFSFPIEIEVPDEIPNSSFGSIQEGVYTTDLETRSFNNQVLLGLRAAFDIQELVKSV